MGLSETMAKKQLEGSEIQTGACRFCGQIYQFETDGRATEEQLDKWAAEKCDCVDAKIEQRYAERVHEATANIEEMLEESGEDPERMNFATDLIYQAINLIARQEITSIAVVTRGGYKVSAKINGNGSLKTEISKTIKKSKEA